MGLNASLKTLTVALTMLLTRSIVLAQDIIGAQFLIEKGVELHDAGKYNLAIQKYDSALVIDPDNIAARGEKALSLEALNMFEEAIEICKDAIKLQPNSRYLSFIYTAYGNMLDRKDMPNEAIKIYNEGIAKFPEYAQLHYNKGITETSLNKTEEAILSFQKSIDLNPQHRSSNSVMGSLLYEQSKNIPALFALCRFLVLEPESNQSETVLKFVQDILQADVVKTGKNSVTINIDPIDVYSDENGEKQENDFRTCSIILSMSSAIEYQNSSKKSTEADIFMEKFISLCNVQKEGQRENFGFYWRYYVPYFLELNEKGHSEAFANVIFASLDNRKINKWLKNNPDKIKSFFQWNSQYDW